MKRTLALIALALPFAASAQLFPDNEARKAILELRTQVETSQKDNAARLERLESRASSGQLDLTQQLESLRAEIARLRGQIEVLQKEVADVQKRQRDQFADLDARLKKQEPQKAVVEGREVTVDPAEQKAYNAAFELFRQSQFAPAVSAFTQFLREWPGSAYAPLAQYWLGNAQYASRDFKGAIATHREFIKAASDNPRVPDALINIGNSQLELNDKAGARRTFRDVVDKFPGTPAAQTARERLTALK
ncbi:MAG TPA: tol-pal system protein YbgF [Burkholderiaceae bacterium]|nr:tol-pal system protein YbgF [Burkholderiaceae bacterium]